MIMLGIALHAFAAASLGIAGAVVLDYRPYASES
jgi:hypothetical protein